MAIPTFDSTALTTNSERETIGQARVRWSTADLPSVGGTFLSVFGLGGRMIQGFGYLQGTGASEALAHAALMTALRTKQLLADGATVATYVGVDANSYTDCLLISYNKVGDVEMSPIDGATYTARIPVVFAVFQQVT